MSLLTQYTNTLVRVGNWREDEALEAVSEIVSLISSLSSFALFCRPPRVVRCFLKQSQLFSRFTLDFARACDERMD